MDAFVTLPPPTPANAMRDLAALLASQRLAAR
jgi:hypothetical protein